MRVLDRWANALRVNATGVAVGTMVMAGLLCPTAGARMSSQAAEQTSPADPVQSKAPAMVFIIRHAEKPLGGGKDPDLAPQGFKRAQVLPTLFLQQPGSSKLPRLPRPDAIFASDFSKNSKRPIETVMPLSQALHLPVNHDFADLETGPVAKQILSGKYAGKVVLICWHHGEIPRLAEAFGVTGVPKRWDDTVYDQIWMIEWLNGKPQMSMISENLLPGDSTK